jgi:tetratricopeptide (TPR) repeat protein
MKIVLKDIKTLKEEYDKVPSSDNLLYVKFHEENLDSINNIDLHKDTAHYNVKLKLTCEYGISLFGSGQYTKAVKTLSEAIPMFENERNWTEEELKAVGYFENLLWYQAVSLYETNKINESIVLLQRLTNYYPQNDRYNNWLKAIKSQKITKSIRPLWFVAVAWVVAEFTVFENFDSRTQFILSIIGFALFAIGASFEFYNYIFNKKK